MPGRVQGKVAIVTGGASGIGAETSRRLAAEGALVTSTDVNEAAGKEIASEIGGSAAFLAHDVSDEASWQEVIAEVLRRHGRLDVLVNNAGIVEIGTVEDTTLELWRRVHAVNSEGVFLGCKHAIPAMRESGGGSIVNISSLAGLRGTPVYAAYSASKGAVRSLTKTVAVHCRDKGDPIRCNSIHPGGVSTPMVHGLVPGGAGPDLSTPEGARSARAAGLGLPGDIANLVLYLASDESLYMNGAELAIDGGATAAAAMRLSAQDPD